MSNLSHCPKCNADWDGGSIFDALRSHDYYRNKTDEQLQKHIEDTYSPPYRWKREIGIEILGMYDGISYWQCPDCKATFDRWTGEETIITGE